MLDEQTINLLDQIVGAIRGAGYDPYAQLIGYLQSSDIRYITRSGNARARILQIDKNVLIQYLERME